MVQKTQLCSFRKRIRLRARFDPTSAVVAARETEPSYAYGHGASASPRRISHQGAALCGQGASGFALRTPPSDLLVAGLPGLQMQGTAAVRGW